ncbi:MAG: hypothetical protein HUM72_12485 [Dolichospermum sp.]|nr:hypothetical protein [Dolichospermum sp.]
MTNIVVNKQVSKVIVVNKGIDGTSGEGVPTGGTAGQILKKDSGTDYDTSWENLSNMGVLLASNNLSDVANVNTARNNIGAVSNNESIVNALIFG